jgi:hypothetical protein
MGLTIYLIVSAILGTMLSSREFNSGIHNLLAIYESSTNGQKKIIAQERLGTAIFVLVIQLVCLFYGGRAIMYEAWIQTPGLPIISTLAMLKTLYRWRIRRRLFNEIRSRLKESPDGVHPKPELSSEQES